MKTILGDATKPAGEDVKIIAQLVNTAGGLGMGFGRSLSKKYPRVRSALENWKRNRNAFILGNSQLIWIDDDLYVYQMLAQKGLFEKDGEIPLRYNYLKECLTDLCAEAKRFDASVHMPMIGAGQAKGDWNVIQKIIIEELVNKDVKVNIYMLPKKNKMKHELIFDNSLHGTTKSNPTGKRRNIGGKVDSI